MITYILEANNLFKIGKTTDLNSRLSTIKTANPDIKLIKSYNNDYEKLLHENFKNKRYLNEWFILSKEDIEEIDAIITIEKINEEIIYLSKFNLNPYILSVFNSSKQAKFFKCLLLKVLIVDTELIWYSNSTTVSKLAKELDLSEDRIKQLIKNLCDLGVLIKKTRGVYAISRKYVTNQSSK